MLFAYAHLIAPQSSLVSLSSSSHESRRRRTRRCTRICRAWPSTLANRTSQRTLRGQSASCETLCSSSKRSFAKSRYGAACCFGEGEVQALAADRDNDFQKCAPLVGRTSLVHAIATSMHYISLGDHPLLVITSLHYSTRGRRMRRQLPRLPSTRRLSRVAQRRRPIEPWSPHRPTSPRNPPPPRQAPARPPRHNLTLSWPQTPAQSQARLRRRHACPWANKTRPPKCRPLCLA